MAKKNVRWEFFPTTGEMINFGAGETKLMKDVFREGLKIILKTAKKSHRIEMVIRWRNVGCQKHG